MGVYLGNLSVKQIEQRLGIELIEEDRERLNKTLQEKVNDTPIAPGKWHCFDLPFMFMTHDRKTAEYFRDIFQRYDISGCKEVFQIGWET